MPYVMSGGDDPKMVWIDDAAAALMGQGGTNAGTGTNTGISTGTGGANGYGSNTSGTQYVPSNSPQNNYTNPFKWGGMMPGKGQFQDYGPYLGPSSWWGVNFLQNDTAGQPLSSYHNLLDQYAASRADRNPLQAEGAFNRWNFGGPNTPPDPRWQATSRGLLTGDAWRPPGPVNAAPLPTPGNGTGAGTGPGAGPGPGTGMMPPPGVPPPGTGGGSTPPPVPGNPPGAPGFGPFPTPPGALPIPSGQGSTLYPTQQTGLLGRGQGQPVPTISPYANPQTLRDFYSLSHDQRKAYQAANPDGLQAIINAHNLLLSNQGLGPGAPTGPAAAR